MPMRIATGRVGVVVRVQCALDVDGGADPRNGGREGDEKSVTQGLAHATTERDDLVVHNLRLQPQNVVASPVAADLTQSG